MTLERPFSFGTLSLTFPSFLIFLLSFSLVCFLSVQSHPPLNVEKWWPPRPPQHKQEKSKQKSEALPLCFTLGLKEGKPRVMGFLLSPLTQGKLGIVVMLVTSSTTYSDYPLVRNSGWKEGKPVLFLPFNWIQTQANWVSLWSSRRALQHTQFAQKPGLESFLKS